MFKIGSVHSYMWPVKGAIPKDGGTFEPFNFDVTFRRWPQQEINVLSASAIEARLDDIAFAKRIVIDWKGVQDSNGNELPFSDAALELLLSEQGVASAIVMAFYDSLKGGKQKN